MDTKLLATRLVAYCESVYGTEFCRENGACNILYLEGCDAASLTPNNDAHDLFNDVRAVIQFRDLIPEIVFAAAATCEPGLKATLDPKSGKLGGVARIAIGSHKEKWRMGFHKGDPKHPALVQAAPITVFRDANRDGKRTGDVITANVVGLNQHGTRRGIPPTIVGGYSYGCLVGQVWGAHMTFIGLLAKDIQYQENNDFLFSSTVVDFGKFWNAYYVEKQVG